MYLPGMVRYFALLQMRSYNFIQRDLKGVTYPFFLGLIALRGIKSLFATKNIWSDYDPKLAISEYRYENFGYFLLMDDEWKEKRIFLSQ